MIVITPDGKLAAIYCNRAYEIDSIAPLFGMPIFITKEKIK